MQNTPIISLPLVDFDKKTVKVDFVTGNTKIQTVSYEIFEECTIGEWYNLLKKYSGCREAYVCQVENGDIERHYPLEEDSMKEKYLSLGIDNSQLIMAYEVKLHETKQKLHKYHNFRVYLNPDDANCYVAMVNDEGSFNSYYDWTQSRTRRTKQSRHIELVPINFKQIDSIGYTAMAQESELLKYPDEAQKREIFVKVLNFDNRYSEKVGKPFMFKLLNTYPVASVREAVETTVSSRSYFMRLSTIGKPDYCFVCKRSCHSESKGSEM